MNTRINLNHANPEAYAAMTQLEAYCKTTSISPVLRTLIKLRVSAINGCSFCIDMHTQEAVKLGETLERLQLLSVFQQVPHFTAAEKAALKMAEELALVHQQGLTDVTYQDVAQHFTPEQILELGMINVAINGWNRLVKIVDLHPSLPQMV